MQQRRSDKIDVFDSFRKAMLDYFSRYNKPDEEKKKKSTTTHRIAVSLSKQFPQSCQIDIDYMNADIVVRNKDEILLILLWSNDYLTEKDKERATKVHKEKHPLLTLAFSLLEERSYILIYRFENDFLEYLHIDKEDFSERILKRSSDACENDGQLMLSLKGKTIKKAKLNKKPQ